MFSPCLHFVLKSVKIGSRVYVSTVARPGPGKIVRNLSQTRVNKIFGPYVRIQKRPTEHWVLKDDGEYVLVEKFFLKQLPR